jgi:hypothetical protein
VAASFNSALQTQAEHCARLGSPLYAELLERAAADAEAGGPVAQVLHGHEDDPPGSMLALRLLGAVHRRVLEGALPELGFRYDEGRSAWAAFRAGLSEDAEAIRALLDRPVQTNEVGRCAALLPGFFAAARSGLPLRLLEVGASAGLNLRFDRYRYEAAGFGWGDPESPVRIEFELDDGTPEPTSIEVAERRGCDPQPLDPTTEEGRLTLLSFVWPDQTKRLRRLRAALAAAADLPVAVEQDGAAGWIGARLAEPRPMTTTVVFHSIVMQYLAESEREDFERRLTAAGEAADEGSPLLWLRMEPAGERAEVRLTRWPGGEDRLLAHAGYHGNPVQLLR